MRTLVDEDSAGTHQLRGRAAPDVQGASSTCRWPAKTEATRVQWSASRSLFAGSQDAAPWPRPVAGRSPVRTGCEPVAELDWRQYAGADGLGRAPLSAATSAGFEGALRTR